MLTSIAEERLKEIEGFVNRASSALKAIRRKADIDALHQIHVFLVASELGGEVAYTAKDHAHSYIKKFRMVLSGFAQSVEERLFIISTMSRKVNNMILEIHRESLLKKL
jgi:DNA-directed RNA polymerase subunit F